MRIKSGEEDRFEINMTPIIDMVFLLLIFFLVATKFADIERDVRVKPPASHDARPITALPQEIVINVTQGGNYLVAGVRRSLEDIDALLTRAVKANPRQAVVIRGDRGTVLQHAVNVLNLCEKHKVEHAYLTTRKDQG
jgi:biopolymer transport protein ExbD